MICQDVEKIKSSLNSEINSNNKLPNIILKKSDNNIFEKIEEEILPFCLKAKSMSILKLNTLKKVNRKYLFFIGCRWLNF